MTTALDSIQERITQEFRVMAATMLSGIAGVPTRMQPPTTPVQASDVPNLNVMVPDAGPISIAFAEPLASDPDEEYPQYSAAATLEGLRRVMEVRARRFHKVTGELRPIDPDWLASLRDRFPNWFENVSCTVEPGWSDAIVAMTEWMREEMSDTEAKAFSFTQIKEKFGGLRAYSTHGTMDIASPVLRIPDIMDQVVRCICERTGDPGTMRLIDNHLLKVLSDAEVKRTPGAIETVGRQVA